LTSALDGGEWSASRPGHFIPGERTPGTDWIGGWVGPRAGLDDVHTFIVGVNVSGRVFENRMLRKMCGPKREEGE
jgi:hypothetical protein